MWTCCGGIQYSNLNGAETVGVGGHEHRGVHADGVDADNFSGDWVACVIDERNIHSEILPSNPTIIKIEVQRTGNCQHRKSTTVEGVVPTTEFIEIDRRCVLCGNRVSSTWEVGIEGDPSPPRCVALSGSVCYSECVCPTIDIEGQSRQHRYTITGDNRGTIVRHECSGDIEATACNRIVDDWVDHEYSD